MKPKYITMYLGADKGKLNLSAQPGPRLQPIRFEIQPNGRVHALTVGAPALDFYKLVDGETR